ncbi:MAG: DNA-methyltransferase [Candidatus Dormibacteria bacterium]
MPNGAQHPQANPLPQAGEPGRLLLGDNLEILRRLPDEVVDLVYLDPPFGAGGTRRLDVIRTGQGTGRRRGFGGREYRFQVVSRQGFPDGRDPDQQVEFLRPRLEEVRRVLRPTGSLYLHLDFHLSAHARLLLDQVFGRDRFLNEIIWAYDYGGRARDRWPRKHDNILWYAKSDRWTFNRDEIERIPYMSPSLVGADKARRGKLPTDTWWLTVVPTAGKERCGYPTQKPLALLERIIRASSNSGELVADFFCGSGTTGVAAQRLGRRYLLVDESPVALAIAQRRLASELSRG